MEPVTQRESGDKQMPVPSNRNNGIHSAVIEANKTVCLEELIASLHSNRGSIRRILGGLKDIYVIIMV